MIETSSSPQVTREMLSQLHPPTKRGSVRVAQLVQSFSDQSSRYKRDLRLIPNKSSISSGPRNISILGTRIEEEHSEQQYRQMRISTKPTIQSMEWLMGTQDHRFEVKLRGTVCGGWIRRRVYQRTLRINHLGRWGFNESQWMIIVEISRGTTESGKYHYGR